MAAGIACVACVLLVPGRPALAQDADGDGIADKREVVYSGVGIGRDGNLEHEQNGFVWGLDNWIYSTYNAFRFRWTPSGVQREATPGNGEGQGTADAAAKEDKALEDGAAKRFNSTPEVRRMFGLPMSIGEQDPTYQAALKRYVARERQWAKDEKAHGTKVTNAK